MQEIQPASKRPHLMVRLLITFDFEVLVSLLLKRADLMCERLQEASVHGRV